MGLSAFDLVHYEGRPYLVGRADGDQAELLGAFETLRVNIGDAVPPEPLP